MGTGMESQWMGLGAGLTAIIVILFIWDFIWKGIGMWKAARLGQKGWFVAIFILNTLGILPIIYIYAVAKPAEKRISSGNVIQT